MPVEAATFVQDLVETNPVGATDERRFGDDHLRIMKLVLKNTFPEATAALRFLRCEVRTSDTGALGVADKAKAIIADASYTQTFASAATLGNGWWCIFRNHNMAQTSRCSLNITINGIASPFHIYPGESILIFTDGSLFYGFGLKSRVFMDFRGGAFAGGCEFGNIGANAPRFKSFELEWDALSSVNPSDLWLQTSGNNGVSWSTNYDHVRHYISAANENVGIGDIADGQIVLATGFVAGSATDGKVQLILSNNRVSWNLNYIPQGTTLALVRGWGSIDGASNAVRLLFSSGAIAAGATDAVRLYGIT